MIKQTKEQYNEKLRKKLFTEEMFERVFLEKCPNVLLVFLRELLGEDDIGKDTKIIDYNKEEYDEMGSYGVRIYLSDNSSIYMYVNLDKTKDNYGDIKCVRIKSMKHGEDVTQEETAKLNEEVNKKISNEDLRELVRENYRLHREINLLIEEIQDEIDRNDKEEDNELDEVEE